MSRWWEFCIFGIVVTFVSTLISFVGMSARFNELSEKCRKCECFSVLLPELAAEFEGVNTRLINLKLMLQQMQKCKCTFIDETCKCNPPGSAKYCRCEPCKCTPCKCKEKGFPPKKCMEGKCACKKRAALRSESILSLVIHEGRVNVVYKGEDGERKFLELSEEEYERICSEGRK